ncbi:hypothetical protein G5C51_23050 [Streptomyces sp. A7024]|uniref:Uncharacterized protein n=1 Tax=Streptomyces coryli TaxID=1128680 RepID=A0A6G4U3D4_9ACTN|nr:hypothetical protein [Streptomyces coryli]NGN66769.1 hypothetical protein [Streptomyces coryli]
MSSQPPSAARSLTRTLLVALAGWAIAGGLALLDSALPEFVAFAIGFVASLAFVVAVAILHNGAFWLALLSLLPGAALFLGAAYWTHDGAGWAIAGAVVWTPLVLYAGRRGHLRRKRGKEGGPLEGVVDYMQRP